MKKVICVLMSAVFLASFASCGSDSKAESDTAVESTAEVSPDGKWKLIAVDQGNGDVLDIDDTKNYKCYDFSGTAGTIEVKNPVENQKRTVLLKKDGDKYTILDGAEQITGVTFEENKMSYTDIANFTYIFEKQ